MHILIQKLEDQFKNSKGLVLCLAWDLSCAQQELQDYKLLPHSLCVFVTSAGAGSTLGQKERLAPAQVPTVSACWTIFPPLSNSA